ncbi:hypothetical protein EMPG_10709, partial [Blastomyces silverae]
WSDSRDTLLRFLLLGERGQESQEATCQYRIHSSVARRSANKVTAARQIVIQNTRAFLTCIRDNLAAF